MFRMNVYMCGDTEEPLRDVFSCCLDGVACLYPLRKVHGVPREKEGKLPGARRSSQRDGGVGGCVGAQGEAVHTSCVSSMIAPKPERRCKVPASRGIQRTGAL